MEKQKIKDNIRDTFNTVAKSYDKNQQFIISAKKMADLLHCDNDKLTILDLSTGTGSVAIELAKKYPNANIFAIDISDEMLNVARQKTSQLGLGNITYLLQDVENMNFEGIKFDIVTCGYGLFFYPDMEKVVSDVFNRLSDDGKFIFSTFTEKAFLPYSKIFLDVLERNYNITPPSRIEKRQLVTHDEIEKLFAHIEGLDLETHDIEIVFPMEIDEWWQLLNSTGYKGLLNQLESKYSQFEKEYIEHLQSISNDNLINFNANSMISIVCKTKKVG